MPTRVLLHYSGHYSDILVEVSDEMLAEIERLDKGRYLQHSEEGRALIEKLQKLPPLKRDFERVVVCYI